MDALSAADRVAAARRKWQAASDGADSPASPASAASGGTGGPASWRGGSSAGASSAASSRTPSLASGARTPSLASSGRSARWTPQGGRWAAGPGARARASAPVTPVGNVGHAGLLASAPATPSGERRLAGPVESGSALEYARRGGGGAGRYAKVHSVKVSGVRDDESWRGATPTVRRKVMLKTRDQLEQPEDEVDVLRGDDVDDSLDAFGEGFQGDTRERDEAYSFDGESESASRRESRADEFSDGGDVDAAAEFSERADASYYQSRAIGDDFDEPPVYDDPYDRDAAYDAYDDGDASPAPADDAEAAGPVRQGSDFSRLSAQSWLTVDSAESLSDPASPPVVAAAPAAVAAAAAAAAPAAAAAVSEPERRASRRGAAVRDDGYDDVPVAAGRRSSAREDVAVPEEAPPPPRVKPRPVLSAPTHMDLPALGRPAGGGLLDVMDLVRSKGTMEKTVLECAIELLASTPAYKKKAWRRFGVRRVWLSANCERLCWTSKKEGVQSDYMRLARVARLRSVDREVSIDVMEGHRVTLLFANAEEANMWTRCLSCLIPLQSRVRAPPSVVPTDKEREDYTLVDDMFNGRPLRSYGSVNAYVVLGPVRGHSGEARLVLSRADKAFFGMRYVSPAKSSFLLRSHEEIAVLKRLHHPNLVLHHECLVDPTRGGNYMIFEHAPRGVVTDTHRLEGVAPIPERAARIIMRDVLNALEYMHALRIVHADVRPDNLLRAVNGSVKVNPIGCITQDFTEIQDMTALVKARLGTSSPAFLAPELCWHGDAPPVPHKSYAMDVWAVGAVLYFLLYGRVPFGGENSRDIQQNICGAKLKFPRQPETSRKVRNLLKGVLGEKDPKTRIALAELKKHPWFAEGIEEEASYLSTSPPNVRLVVTAEEVEAAVGQAKVRAPPGPGAA